jgi:hypothetical protein
MKLLFLTHPYPNYVPDLLLHGLRKLLGGDVVDYPRKACLYEGVLGLGVCPDDQRCPGWFPEDEGLIDRTDIQSKIQNGHFDFVVCDLRILTDVQHFLIETTSRWVIIDGEDHPHPISPGPFVICRRETDGSDNAIPIPMALPEEIFHWITRYDAEPKRYTIGFLGSTREDGRKAFLNQLAQRYGNTLFQATETPSTDDPVPQGRLSRDAYYRRLQQCRVVLSLPGAGIDTFRFWEHTACNALHASPLVPLFIPGDFKNQHEIIRFENLDQLCCNIDRLMNGRQAVQDVVRHGRFKLLNHHMTTHRAAYFLNCITKAFNC